MASANKTATHKFVIVLNEKSPVGKLLSATGQLAMSLFADATSEQREHMNFVPFHSPTTNKLIVLSTTSFVVLKGTQNQLLTLYSNTQEQNILSAIFTSTMSFNGIEEDLIHKTANTDLGEVEIYGVGLFGLINELTSLTKKFSVFK
ncbi:MAG: DUF2000 family protein [Proteobacteria bacterium]|nr:DUF2000 family protein [Pseudomonadota bacterium]